MIHRLLLGNASVLLSVTQSLAGRQLLWWLRLFFSFSNTYWKSCLQAFPSFSTGIWY